MSEQLAIGSQTRWCTHDVLPAADNDILLPVLDIQEPLLVLVPEIAGLQPPVLRQDLHRAQPCALAPGPHSRSRARGRAYFIRSLCDSV